MGDIHGVVHVFLWLLILALFFEIVNWMVNKRGPM